MLCESEFSTLTNTKYKKREQLLSVEQEKRVCLSLIPPRIELLSEQHQRHVSY